MICSLTVRKCDWQTRSMGMNFSIMVRKDLRCAADWLNAARVRGRREEI